MCRGQALCDQGISDTQQNAIATAEDSPDRLAQNKLDFERLVIVTCIKVVSACWSTTSRRERARHDAHMHM
jgi:hypothetical protein